MASKRATKTAIHNLPDEVMDEIFKLLDFETIRNCHKVCKGWNEKISIRVRNAARQQQWLVKGDNLNIYSIEDEKWMDFGKATNISLPARFTHDGTFAQLLGAVNNLWVIGVIAKASESFHLAKLLVCNPVTKTICMDIPYPEYFNHERLEFVQVSLASGTEGTMLVILDEGRRGIYNGKEWEYKDVTGWCGAGLSTGPPLYLKPCCGTVEVFTMDPHTHIFEKTGDVGKDLGFGETEDGFEEGIRDNIEDPFVIFRCMGGETYAMGFLDRVDTPFVCVCNLGKWSMVSECQDEELRSGFTRYWLNRFSWSNGVDRICIGGLEYNIGTKQWREWKGFSSHDKAKCHSLTVDELFFL